MTAADWQRVAEAEELAKTLGEVVNTVGVFEDGTYVASTGNKQGTEVFVAVWSKNPNDAKTWSGKATTDENGKETITDSTTGDTISYTWTENEEDGTVTIDSDEYGKGTLIKMTVADWLILEEISKSTGLR